MRDEYSLSWPRPGHFYRPQTKLRGANVFTEICLFTGGKGGGGLVQRGVGCGVEGVSALPPKWLLLRALRILLECILTIMFVLYLCIFFLCSKFDIGHN